MFDTPFLDIHEQSVDYSLESLDKLGLSLESANSTPALENIFSAIGTAISTVIAMLIKKITAFFSGKSDTEKKEEDWKKMNSILERSSFTVFEDKSFAIPTHFKGSLVKYIRFLEPATEDLAKDFKASLPLHTERLGKMINTRLNDRKYGYYNTMKKHDKFTQTLKKEYGKFYSGKSTNDMTIISSVFKNNNEIADFVSDALFFTLSKEQLQEIVTDLSLEGMVSGIREEMRRTDREIPLNKAVLKDISAGLYVLAESAEFLAVLLEENMVMSTVAHEVMATVNHYGGR